MLTMAQQGLATCLIEEDGRPVTQFMRLPETPCLIDGIQYRMSRDSTSRCTLEGPLGAAAVAYPSGKREITVDTTPHHFQLRRVNWTGSRWELHVFGQPAGTWQLGTLSATGDLPTEFSLPVRVFTVYTMVMWGAAKFVPWGA